MKSVDRVTTPSLKTLVCLHTIARASILALHRLCGRRLGRVLHLPFLWASIP